MNTQNLFYEKRLRVGYAALFSGVLSGLSAFLLIPYEVGLCNPWEENNNCSAFKDFGIFLFIIFFSFFVVGSLFFTLSNKNRTTLRKISLWIIPFALIFYFVVPGNDSDFSFPSIREIIGWPLVVIYSAIIMAFAIKELFSPIIKRFPLWKITLTLLILTLTIFWTIINWL